MNLKIYVKLFTHLFHNPSSQYSWIEQADTLDKCSTLVDKFYSFVQGFVGTGKRDFFFVQGKCSFSADNTNPYIREYPPALVHLDTLDQVDNCNLTSTDTDEMKHIYFHFTIVG